jgi:hypothetical protein
VQDGFAAAGGHEQNQRVATFDHVVHDLSLCAAWKCV